MTQKSVAADIKLQKSVTGELIAFDTNKRIIVATGFESEEEFEQWLKLQYDQ